ncbi:Wzz/FepE/Etk N-terminal domain-containing protein [Marinobacterium aestuariivivens]|uniref:Wzz/FepE/Etk N-terminal domain-containing protein n=1 Tax=Marinobacterium aestuariivivens TaxID=1698799 RepID=A0ABW1ZZJ6_9GAMM
MDTQLITQPSSLPERLREPERSRDDEIDLLRLWQPIWRRKWSIATLTLVVMMLAALVALAITPIYRAASTLMIEEQTAQVLSIQQVYGLDGSSSEYLQTQFELLKSRELAERVVHELELDSHPEFDPRQQSSSSSISAPCSTSITGCRSRHRTMSPSRIRSRSRSRPSTPPSSASWRTP